ncbi:hypothetical protein I6M86_05695 [Citrobacter cronae]|uniref:hypothetical protein n=1 Tax=Citrobacter cronae TaxID=1748967 RepID=UPI0019004004|nr:hypothetical protein [Citrobacter cronae]MBJ8376038.1 hypothetical protein [Citrobacter cronae]
MVAMSKEALRIYNANRRKKGLPLIQDDSDTFTQETEEVTPYITGLQTTTDDPDYAKNIKQELDWISNSTHYLFDAVDAAQDAYTQAQQAASDATDAYNAAQEAQTTANDAMNTAITGLQEQQKELEDQQTQITANLNAVTQAQTDATNALLQAEDAAGIATTANETAGTAITNAATAQSAAEQTQTDAINANTQSLEALNQSALTSSVTASYDSGSGGDHTITIVDNKEYTRTISVLPVVAIVAGTQQDSASVSMTAYVNGVQVFSQSHSVHNESASIIFSYQFSMPPGSGNQTVRVVQSGGGYVISFSNVTVLATQDGSNDFIVS